jgi:uncharacterized protein YndB with AHSA1/START domain
VRVERSVQLPCPPEEAWAVLVDWERQRTWMLDADRVDVISDLRAGVGVRLAVRTRVAGIAAFTEPIEVIGWEPPRFLVVRHGVPVSGVGTWSLDRLAGGTRFTWAEEVTLRVPVLGVIAAACYRPVLGALMARSMRRLLAIVITAGPRRP